MSPIRPRFGGFYELSLATAGGQSVDPRAVLDRFKGPHGEAVVDELSQLTGAFTPVPGENYEVYSARPSLIVAANDMYGDDYDAVKEALAEEKETGLRYELADDDATGADVEEGIVRDLAEEKEMLQVNVTFDHGLYRTKSENPFTELTIFNPQLEEDRD